MARPDACLSETLHLLCCSFAPSCVTCRTVSRGRWLGSWRAHGSQCLLSCCVLVAGDLQRSRPRLAGPQAKGADPHACSFQAIFRVDMSSARHGSRHAQMHRSRGSPDSLICFPRSGAARVLVLFPPLGTCRWGLSRPDPGCSRGMSPQKQRCRSCARLHSQVSRACTGSAGHIAHSEHAEFSKEQWRRSKRAACRCFLEDASLSMWVPAFCGRCSRP